MDPYVIVGAGLAGAKAAETLRAEGFDGPVVLIGDEDELPYERPPLSKGYLLGKDPREGSAVHPAEWYDEQGIELRLGTRVTAIHPAEHEVELAGGERIRYGKLLLATGSLVRPAERARRRPGDAPCGSCPTPTRSRRRCSAAAGWSSSAAAGSGWRSPPRPGSTAAR